MNTVKINSKQTKMIAHRGLSGLETENTCPAFVAAGNRSYYGIETDVHVTNDGQFVIIHDETTARVTNGDYIIDVEDNNYSDIKNIVLPDKDGSTHRQDIRIPLLIEYIKICKKYDKVCVLEVKNHFPKADIERLVDEFKKAQYIEKVIFISFDFQNCLNLRQLLPKNDIQWLTGLSVTPDMIKTLKENRLNLDIAYHKLTKKIVDRLHLNGIKVNCWTCDEKQEAEKLVKMGVDFITTNILE